MLETVLGNRDVDVRVNNGMKTGVQQLRVKNGKHAIAEDT